MEFTRKVNEEKSGNIITQVIYRFIPYWPLFLLFFVLGMGSAYLYMRFATPMYETSASLLIKDEKKGASEIKPLETLDNVSPKKIIENEMEVIKSGTLLYEVVSRLHLYAPVYRETTLKKVSAYSTSPITIEAASTDAMMTVDKVYFDFDKNRSVVKIDNRSYPINTWNNTPYGKLKFVLVNRPRRVADGKLFFSLISPKSAASSIENRLQVSTSNKMTSILNITFTDDDPKRGEAILNELLTVYSDAIIRDKNILANNTLKFIETRLQTVEHDLDSIEKRIQQFKSQRGVTDISTQGRLFLENVSSNDQRVGDINMQLAVLNQVEGYVDAKDKTTGMVPSTLGVSDPTLTSLVDKLYTSELEYERLKKTTAENNPVLVAVTDRIEKIKPSIIENIRSQRRSLEASKGNLSATSNNYSSVLRTMPEKERELIDINREQSIKNGIYTFLLQKREETALAYAATVSDSRIIDKAESSDSPVSPKKKIVYFSSFLLALISGMGLVYARESFGRKVMFRQEIEQLTNAPIIGEISQESISNPIVISDIKKTFIAEQFRKLRVSLSYIGVNSKRKRILVTSSISGEGKSFVATNLAHTLSLTNKKVVLVDLDLNNPTLVNKLKITGQKGVAEYLDGEAELKDIVIQTDVNPNLYMVSSGRLPHNPTEMIMNGRVEELLNNLDASFDYIIIDTAPVLPVTDAFILSPFCDATLYVVRHGYTPKVFVERLDHNNKINHLNNIAIVFNGVTPRGFGKSHYGYGYGYGYVYDDRESRKRLTLRS
jgi:tyrosine-protein kinase Etk/Wzc